MQSHCSSYEGLALGYWYCSSGGEGGPPARERFCCSTCRRLFILKDLARSTVQNALSQEVTRAPPVGRRVAAPRSLLTRHVNPAGCVSPPPATTATKRLICKC